MKSKFMQWIKRVRDTRDEEIDCSVCLDLVSDYVDLELTAQDAAQLLPAVKHHLDQCQVCREEYLVLRELARHEHNGGPPSIEELAERLKRRSE